MFDKLSCLGESSPGAHQFPITVHQSRVVSAKQTYLHDCKDLLDRMTKRSPRTPQGQKKT